MSEQSTYREKIRESEGNTIHWACVSFETSIEIHKNNSEQLVDYISNPIIKPFSLFPTTEHRKQKIQSDKEVTRLLHNYVASAKTLVERSRIFSNKYLTDQENKKYKDKVEKLIDENPVILFVQSLRNYLLHKDNPSIIDSLNPKENTNNIGLMPLRLLEWNKWDSSTKKYLKSLPEKECLYLSLVIDEYNSEAFAISKWLLRTAVISNKSKLKELYDLHKKYIDTGRGLMFDPYLSNNYLSEFQNV